MKKLSTYVLLLLIIPIKGYSQFTCANDDIAPPSVNSIGATCSFSPYYTPDDLTQTKNVRITLHVIQDDNGLNNFQDTPTERNWLTNDVVGNTNWVLSALQPMNLTTTSAYIQNSKIKFVVDDIFFHQNTYLYNSQLGTNNGYAGNIANQLYNIYVTNNSNVINKTNSIHIFLVGGTGGMACGFGCNDWTLVTRVYENYINGGNFWDPAGLLRHELGHNLGLYHSWGSDNCGDTPSNPNCWNGPTCSNNMMDYNAGKNALTECQLANMHYYLTNGVSYNLFNSISNGNGTDIVANYCETNNNLVIDNNSITTWYNSRYIQGDLIIKNNSTLVITCEVYMPENKQIIIEKGGKLIVDGGTITNQCGKMWGGIEVRGNMYASQMTTGAQGRLEIKNGALIENCYSIHASEGDANGQYIYGTFGGIIQITNSTIKNNRSGVEFGPYQNYNPNNPSVKLNDLSFIKNNQFIWDGTGNMNNLGVPNYSFIGLWEVHGISIEGNSFKNNNIASSPRYQQGHGIISYDSDFTVKPSCYSPTYPCPSSSNVPNTFENLKYGIKDHGISGVSRVIINGNTFTNNRFGVGLLATTYTSVLSNTFNLPISNIPIESGGDAIGIYSAGSYGYNFEENTFNTTGTGPSNGSNYGIVSDNSSINGGLVYRNNFNNIIVANLNSQDNRSLRVDCNNFSSGALSRYDMAITSGDLSDQGYCFSSTLKPAKNSFNSGCSGDKNIFHYVSTPASLIYSALTTDLPSCISSPEVFNNSCLGSNTTQNTCPSNITSPIDPSVLDARISSGKQAIINLMNQIDGGDQATLINVINSMPNGHVKNELLAASPYLSDKVLVSFLEKPNPLPAGHIKQIIVANSPVTDKVKEVLNTIALPNGIRSQINASQIGLSSRQLLENEITQLGVEIQLLKNESIRRLLDNQSSQAVEDVLSEEKSSADKIVLIPLVIKSDQQKAEQLITELRTDANDLRALTPNCPIANRIDKSCDYYSTLRNNITSSGNFSITSGTDEQTLRTLAASSTPISINAKNALALYKGEVFEYFAEPINLTPSNNARIKNNTILPNSLSPNTYNLNNYPNPFNDNTIIEVLIPPSAIGQLVINDVTGKQIKTINLNDSNNKIEINGNELGYGMFFYSLYVNGEYVQTKKMTRIQ